MNHQAHREFISEIRQDIQERQRRITELGQVIEEIQRQLDELRAVEKYHLERTESDRAPYDSPLGNDHSPSGSNETAPASTVQDPSGELQGHYGTCDDISQQASAITPQCATSSGEEARQTNDNDPKKDDVALQFVNSWWRRNHGTDGEVPQEPVPSIVQSEEESREDNHGSFAQPSEAHDKPTERCLQSWWNESHPVGDVSEQEPHPDEEAPEPQPVEEVSEHEPVLKRNVAQENSTEMFQPTNGKHNGHDRSTTDDSEHHSSFGGPWRSLGELCKS